MGRFNTEGALTGAGTGAAIGTAILPGVGTGLGAVAGGLLGSGWLSPDEGDVNAGLGAPEVQPYEQHSTGPGLQNGKANMGGLDMTQPGMAETYANDTLQRYGGGNTPKVTNNAQDFYGSMEHQYASSAQPTNNSAGYAADYNKNKPQIQADAGIGQYYNNAEKNAAAGINAQMASRGMYGSSAATGQLAGMYANMEGNRARDTADYGLKAAGEMRAQSDLGGRLVGQGDTQSNAMASNDRDWTRMDGEAASAADRGSLDASRDKLSWTEGLGNVANSGQDHQRTRGQDAFNDEMQIGDRYNGMMGDTYDGMFKDDRDVMDSATGIQLGTSTENQNIQKEKGNGIMGKWTTMFKGMGS